MIAKCARAKALKIAFSDELSGLHIEEEKAAFEDATIQAAEVKPAVGVNIDELQNKLLSCGTIEELTVVAFTKPLIIADPELPVDWIINPRSLVGPVNKTALVELVTTGFTSDFIISPY